MGGVREEHCLHSEGNDGDVCCWCGDMFLTERGELHGEYEPDFEHKVATLESELQIARALNRQLAARVKEKEP